MFGIPAWFRTGVMLSTKQGPEFENRVLAPRKSSFTTFSLKIPSYFRGPAWIRTRGTPLSDLLSVQRLDCQHAKREDRKSTRLNSSHPSISYAVFCLKK